MFKRILAIDVSSRIENFKKRAGILSTKEPLVLRHANIEEISPQERNDIDALWVSIYEQIDEEFLKAFPALRFVNILGTSSKKIDTGFCSKHDIAVSVVKEYCDDETAEWVILQILKFFRENRTPKSAYDKRLGIIGFGSVGKKLAYKAKGLGLKVLVNTLSSEVGDYEQASKEHIFAQCDVVSFHTPPHSPWLLKEQLMHTKSHGVLINTCFGAIDKYDALKEFLNERPDVTLILDQIAKPSYEHMPSNVRTGQESAYLTADSTARLAERFFANARNA